MKRIRIYCLLLLCILLCSACGNSAASDNARQLNPATETQPEATDPATGETTLVATPLPVTAQKPVLQNGETYTGLPALALLAYLGFISAAAYSLWSLALAANPVSRVAVFGFMNPVFGVLLSAVLLGETNVVSPVVAVAALVLVSLGIVIVNVREGKAPSRD